MGLIENYDEALILAHGENFTRFLKERVLDINPEGYGGLDEGLFSGAGFYTVVDSNKKTCLGLCRKRLASMQIGNVNSTWIPDQYSHIEIYDRSLLELAKEYVGKSGIDFEVIDCSKKSEKIAVGARRR